MRKNKATTTSSSQSRLTTFFARGGKDGTDRNKATTTKMNIPSTVSGRKRRIDGSSFGICPICEKSTALYKLEAHAAQCNGRQEVKTEASICNVTPSSRLKKQDDSPSIVTPPSSITSLRPSGEAVGQSLAFQMLLPYSEPIHGLFVFENILTVEEEAPIIRLLDFEDVLPWKTSRFNGISYGKRWGVHCNLRDRRVDAPEHPLPQVIQDFLQSKLSLVKEILKERNALLLDFLPNEANAIDYRRKEGHWLQAHVDDRQLSKEPIANLSLIGDCFMTFRNQKRSPVSIKQPEEHRVLLKRGTLQILTGRARYDYSHAIANADLLSDRRVSITMRESPLTVPPSEKSQTALARKELDGQTLPHFAWRNHHLKSRTREEANLVNPYAK